jgi:hypothetical protein
MMTRRATAVLVVPASRQHCFPTIPPVKLQQDQQKDDLLRIHSEQYDFLEARFAVEFCHTTRF